MAVGTTFGVKVSSTLKKKKQLLTVHGSARVMETQFLLNFLNAIFHCCEHHKLNSLHLHDAWDAAEKRGGYLKTWKHKNKLLHENHEMEVREGVPFFFLFFFVIWVTLESTGSLEHSWANWASLSLVLATTESLWAAYLGTFMTLSSQEDLAA